MLEKRKSNFEMLRILSMCMIVAFHYVFKAGFEFSGGVSANKILVDFFYHFGECGVNCFILISGYFYDTTRFQWKKVVFIVLQVYFYLLLGRVVLLFTGNTDVVSRGTTSYLFPVIGNYYWFVTAYLLVYLLIPYIQKIINALSQKELRNLILIQLTIWSVYPTVLFGSAGFNNTEDMPYYSRFVWLVVMYLMGAYMKQYGIGFLGTLKQSILFECGMLAVLFAFIIGTEWGLNPLEMDATFFWRPNSILMVMLSVGLFAIFSHINVGYHKWINYISSCTLGIYLLHDGDLVSFWWETVFQNASHQNQSNLILHILLAVVIILLLGILCESFRKIIELPIKKKWNKIAWKEI
jgi:surface polysaccharide O-acyltransferase-like enzyme